MCNEKSSPPSWVAIGRHWPSDNDDGGDDGDGGGDEKGLWIERQVGHTDAQPNLTQPSNQAFET